MAETYYDPYSVNKIGVPGLSEPEAAEGPSYMERQLNPEYDIDETTGDDYGAPVENPYGRQNLERNIASMSQQIEPVQGVSMPSTGGYEAEIKKFDTLSDSMGQMYGDPNSDYNKAYSDQVEAENLYQQHYGKIQKEIDDELNRPVDAKIDQSRFWSNASTGQKIAMGIGLLLASLDQNASARAQKAITDAIDRDVDAQKVELDKAMRTKQEKLTAKQQELLNLSRRVGDQRTVYELIRTRAYENAKGMLEAQASKVKSREALYNAQLARATLENKAAVSRNAAAQYGSETATVTAAQQHQAMRALAEQSKDLTSKQIEAIIPVENKQARAAATSAYGALKESEMVLKSIDQHYNKMIKWTALQRMKAKVPGTDENLILNQTRLKIFQPATLIAKGALQNHEFNALVDVNTPSVAEIVNPSRIAQMRDAMKIALTGLYSKEAAPLDMYGIKYDQDFPEFAKIKRATMQGR